jgi:hypothetical protein
VTAIGRPTHVATRLYLALLSIGALTAGLWAIRFIERRVGYGEFLAKASTQGLLGKILAYAPILLLGAALIGGLLQLPFRRLRPWRLAYTLAAAPATVAALYGIHRWLRSYERGYYDRSSYTALYRLFCYPALAATAVFLVVIAIDLLVLRRRRVRTGISPSGEPRVA